ncbi:hypothetical protein TCAL_02668 [Tigriopus californicus]|uniref:Mitoferrin n=1 Tax=Tigriopus californicus TaxID=6832 RepID=A0A553PGV0_TIGCA|nr:mitoferrin-1-like [Tigriopus californicus]TRY76912.1 hypothetical protein TCAL_02668 [Tigriopus californicus]
MADPDDYESLPASTPLSITCLAGATAGIAEHCVMFPVDSVKTRMQSLSCGKQQAGMVAVMRTMVQEEGLFRPMKGMNAMAAGAGPAHALYFTALEKTKEHLVERRNIPEHLASGIAALGATVVHDAVMTPADVIKQRMQMCCSPYSSCTNAAVRILQAEGPRAFYRSYLTQLTMNVPFQASMFISYGAIQGFFNPNKEYSPVIHFVAGAIAGGIGSAVTMPLDVCKTLLNTQEAGVLKQIHRSEVVGLVNAARVVHQVTGYPGFFQGLSARILYQAPATAVSWSVYEFFKYYLKGLNSGQRDDDQHFETLADITALTAAASTSSPR